MGLGVESMEDVLLEISSMQRLLPARPTSEQYQFALTAVARAEHLLASRLEDLVKAQRPEAIPQQAFRALLEMREEVLRMQVSEQKKPWLMLVQLEERHQRYEQLLRKARLGAGQGNGSFGSTTVLNGIESSSSGEFSDEAVRSNGQRFYSSSPAASSTSLASLALETGRFFAVPRQEAHPQDWEVLKKSVSQVREPEVYQQVYAQGRGVSTPVHEQGREAPEPAPKVLSTIDESVALEPHCPPKLLELFEAAAESGSESLSIVDTFFRESVLLPPDSLLARLSNLKVLVLSGNRIVKLPEAIGELRQLEALDVQSNQLTGLPESLGRLAALKKLNVEKNAIEEIPWTIGNCEALEELRADFNQLKALPEAVGYLGNLQILTVHLNCLKSLPTTMAYLTSLKELDVHFNQLESIPESLCFVTTLRRLDVSSNFHALRSLPYKIGNLQQLVELDISYNSILELPDSIVLLTSLQKFRVEGNPWRVPPLEITQKGKEAVFDYMHERVRQKQQEKLARKKRSFVVKAGHACCGFLGRLCESKHGDSGLNIMA